MAKQLMKWTIEWDR